MTATRELPSAPGALLAQLGLHQAAAALPGWLDRAAAQELSYHDFLQGLLEEEAAAIPAAAPGIGVGSGGRIGVASIRDNDPTSCNGELIRLAQLDNDRRFRDMLRSANRANVSI